MKITYLAPSTIPSRTANSIHVMKMCQAFAKANHIVTLCVPDRDNIEPNVKDLFLYYGVEKNFSILKMPANNNRGHRYVNGWQMASFAKSNGSEIVYGRDLPGCFVAAMQGMPTVYESHSPIEDENIIFLHLLRKFINKENTRLVVISQALKEHYLQKFAISKDKVVVAHDGADQAPIVASKENERFQVGYIGHLYQGRGIEVILTIAKKCSWADFHIVGGTNQSVKHWQEQSKDLLNVIFHGFVPPGEVYKLRNQYDVLLAPYQKKVTISGEKGDTSRWMSPLKLFEYMSAGKPIICSNIPVLQEVIENGQNALICPPDDAQSWVSSLERLKGNRQLQKYLGKNALEHFLAYYTWESRAKHVISNFGNRACKTIAR